MNDFRSFLLGKCRIPENKVPFFLQRVSKYNSFSKNSRPGDDSLETSYLNALSQNYENWQVQQAKKAVSLYLYFKNISTHSEIHSGWNSVKRIWYDYFGSVTDPSGQKKHILAVKKKVSAAGCIIPDRNIRHLSLFRR
ncbi:hypothetical protein ES707_22902 [subsurface metagenome]